MQQHSIDAHNVHITRLHPLALAVGVGAATVLGIVLFGTAMGSLWGMMGGAGGGWMHGSVGGAAGSGGWIMGSPGYGGGSMTGSGWGLFAYTLLWGGIGGAIVGGVTAWVYNAFVGRNRNAPVGSAHPSVPGPDR
jgi:hypothetical protein